MVELKKLEETLATKGISLFFRVIIVLVIHFPQSFLQDCLKLVDHL